MGLLKNIAQIGHKGYQPSGTLTVHQNIPPLRLNDPIVVGNNVVLYPQKNGQIYVDKGYNYNADVHAVVSKCAKKFGQVAWYQYKIKKNEVKTWNEYLTLTKDGLTPQSIKEAKLMRKKSIEQNIVDSPLIKKLNKPNELQTGAQYREQLYGYKLLTGEANQLKVRGEDGKILALQIIPKSHILLEGGASPYHIENFIFTVLGKQIIIPPKDLIMWKFPNYNFNETTLDHLRGLAPLDAYLLHLQAGNEAVIRSVNMNNNQGAAGLLYRKDKHGAPDPSVAADIRAQVNNTINSSEMAGAIATMTGEWGYLQFGLNADQLKLIEQAQLNMEKLCNILDVPYSMFKADQTYENKKQAKRDWIFDNIAVACYSLRDEWNNKLVPEYNLDRERDVLDCDILGLPEMTQDLKDQVAALEKADFLTDNEKRLVAGYEPISNPVMDLTARELEMQGMGTNLDDEERLLNE